MTATTDVLIVGGGLAGTATAYYLAREGVEVLLVEQTEINSGASGANAGSIHAQIPFHEFTTLGEGWARAYAPTIPLFRESIRIWAGLSEELGVDLEVKLTGGLMVARSPVRLREVEAKAKLERAHGLEVHLLGREEVLKLAPYISDQMIGGAFAPEEGKANPLKVTPAFARAAERHGARLLRRVAVTGLDQDRQGYRVTTTAGPIRAARVVNCAGAAAGDVARLIGIDLPVLGAPIQLTVTEPMAPLIPHLVYFAGGRLTLKQAANGTFLIGGGWPAIAHADGRLEVDLTSLRDNMRVALDVVPRLGSVQIVRSWPAVVNGTEDWKPILGEVAGHPGFFMGMFPWMGFSAGPIAARTVAQLILGRDPGVDISPFSAERFGR
jgi:glycine/D-amino acid oxidase-like deaminating enzyme